jgi:hypothetical protein
MEPALLKQFIPPSKLEPMDEIIKIVGEHGSTDQQKSKSLRF